MRKLSLVSIALSIAPSLANPPASFADDARVAVTQSDATETIDAERFFPPGDYRLKWKVTYDRAAIGRADPGRAQACYARGVDDLDPREPVRTLARAMSARIPTLLPALAAVRDFAQDHALLLRSLDHWRLVTDNQDALDQYYANGRIAESFKRQASGYRPVFLPKTATTLYYGPAAVVEQLRLFAGFAAANPTQTTSIAQRREWKLDLASLSYDDYLGLRIPLVFGGISKGAVEMTWEPESVSVLIRDVAGDPVGSRQFRLMDGRFAGFIERKWFPGEAAAYETVECEVREFAPKSVSDELFPPGYFEKVHVVDERAGKEKARALRVEAGGLPSDAEFDRLHVEYMQPDTHIRDWAIVAAGALLIAVGIVRHRRR